jgi:TatD family-associated radical SAM protein
VYGSDSLWLEREPTAEEVISELSACDLAKEKEVVFCGYGEPTERLEVLLEVAGYLKREWPGIKVRLNTNGLGDLVNSRDTAALMAGKFDVVSVSLNASDAERYAEVCRPRFGVISHSRLLEFAASAVAVVPEVVLTVVGEPVTGREEQERCRIIAERIGAKFRERAFE